MNEVTLQWIQLVKLLIIAAFAMLYGFGGVSGKWKRRIIAPVVYAAGIVGVSLWTNSFSWLLLYSLPALFIGLTFGYGATFLKDKIIKRSRAGLVCALGSLTIFMAAQAWTLLALHIAVCVATSVVAGVWNQTSSARAEETLIGAAYVTIPLFAI
jgi:hypothetical protein